MSIFRLCTPKSSQSTLCNIYRYAWPSSLHHNHTTTTSSRQPAVVHVVAAAAEAAPAYVFTTHWRDIYQILSSRDCHIRSDLSSPLFILSLTQHPPGTSQYVAAVQQRCGRGYLRDDHVVFGWLPQAEWHRRGHNYTQKTETEKVLLHERCKVGDMHNTQYTGVTFLF